MDRVWAPAQMELLQIACEQTDERTALRFRVLQDARAEDRKALRELDRLIVANLTAIGYFAASGVTIVNVPDSADPEGW